MRGGQQEKPLIPPYAPPSPPTGRAKWMKGFAEDIAALKAEARDIVIVSSGAISLGRRILKLEALSLPLEQSQAAASAGQIALSQAWAEALSGYGIITGQILITP